MPNALPDIPILRFGRAYYSVDRQPIVDHATGEPVALVSQANPGLVARDLERMDPAALDGFTVADLIAACGRAADLFLSATLPLGESEQTFDDYVRQLSATTGLPHVLCRANAEKIRTVLASMGTILSGLTRGLDPAVLDRGHGRAGGGTGFQPVPHGQDAHVTGSEVCFARTARVFGAVLPSNSPGVHSLWLPAVALKTPIALKPGREEPWTPCRVIQAFIAAGLPREAFGFYPGDHAAAAELLRRCDRSMLFGDASTTRPWQSDRRVELHGPGFSKVLLGDDAADRWREHLDVIVDSILANGGRSCVNASAVWTPRHGRELAAALAERLADVHPLPADHPDAKLAAFTNPAVAERISAAIDAALAVGGAAEDLTAAIRAFSPSPFQGEGRGEGAFPSPPGRANGAETRAVPASSSPAGRLVRGPRCAWLLLPTIIWCPDREHPLANREFLFPYAAVVECPADRMADAIGPTLAVTAISDDAEFIRSLMRSTNVDRLNVGAVPTWQVSWDQPHEGNLFEHLYRRRSLQLAT